MIDTINLLFACLENPVFFVKITGYYKPAESEKDIGRFHTALFEVNLLMTV